MSHHPINSEFTSAGNRGISPITANSMNEVVDWWCTRDSGILRLKPRVLLSEAESRYGYKQSVIMPMPSSQIGSITTLEAILLICSLRLAQVSSVVEIGTYLGFSTSLFALNLGDEARVVSIDLPDSHDIDHGALRYSEAQLHSSDLDNDEFLRARQASLGPIYVLSQPDDVRSRVRLVKADSRLLSPLSGDVAGTWGAVFVDGGHDADTARSDSRLAEDLLRGDGLVIWHDYGSKIHGDVTQVVNDFARSQRVLQIEHTMLALMPLGGAGAKLLGRKVE